MLLVQQQLQRENMGTATNTSSSSHKRSKLFIAQIPTHSSHTLHYARKSYNHVPPDHPLRYFLAKRQQHPVTYEEVERQVALEKDNFSKFFILQDEDEGISGSGGKPHFQVRPHEYWPLLLGKKKNGIALRKRKRFVRRRKSRPYGHKSVVWKLPIQSQISTQ